MPLLPAVVPPLPLADTRTPIPERLARNVAPLFGMPWPEGPFEQRTWVCDYGRVTLSEIARGAPLPTRTKARDLARDITEWKIVQRVGVTGPGSSLPFEIPNASLTRFGPDTKAAVVLTAANVLLAPVTDAVRTALSLLVAADGTPLPVELRLAAWAGLVLETFRSQPALVAAAIRARTIQRELASWQLPLADNLADLPLTRCEIGARDPGGRGPSPDQPRTLDVADQSFELLQVPVQEEPLDGADPDEPADDAARSEATRRLLSEETVDLLLRRLLATGTPHDASHLWLSEREPGRLAVEAFIPPRALVGEFVDRAMGSLGVTTPATSGPPDTSGSAATQDAPTEGAPTAILPRVPTPEELASLPIPARRAVFLALHAVLLQVQYRPPTREASRDRLVTLLEAIGARTRSCLDHDDPVAVLTRCRVADMAVHALRHDLRNKLRPQLDELRAELRHIRELVREGVLDRGAAAEAVSSANVEINAVRWTDAEDPAAGLPPQDELHADVRHNWGFFHDLLELRSDSSIRSAGYHLHNYANFLASPPSIGTGNPPDLARAVRMFDNVVIPAREAFHARTGSHLPLRVSLQVGARAASRLAKQMFDDGDLIYAAQLAETARGWIHRALAYDDTVALLDAIPTTERAHRLALAAAATLILTAEAHGPGATAEDLATARRLIRIAQAWEDMAMGAKGEHYARHDEVVALSDRLDALTRSPAP